MSHARAVTGRRKVGAEDLHASATRITGLADFGADDYRDGLAVLLESCARDAGLTRTGREGDPGLPARRAGGPAAQRGGVGAPPGLRRGRPSNGRSSSPGCPGPARPRCTACSRPTRRTRAWSCGSPRCRSPARRGRPGPATRCSRRIQAAYERHHVTHPEFMGVHYMAADQVEECWQLLRQSMRSVSYECLAHLPSYSAWLRRPGLDGRLPQAPAQPAADRPARPRPPLGAEEPEPPVRARRAAARSTRTRW